MWGTKSASYNLCVFDLGEQIVNSNECCDEVVKIKTRSEGGDGGKISCVANHGGKNCSNAFGINNGRCTFNPNVCMDYNGWFTDCVNGKVSNFPGSDCDTAMGRGECWNEIMQQGMPTGSPKDSSGCRTSRISKKQNQNLFGIFAIFFFCHTFVPIKRKNEKQFTS